MTLDEVMSVLAEVQNVADAFAGLEIVKAANFFTAAQVKPASSITVCFGCSSYGSESGGF